MTREEMNQIKEERGYSFRILSEYTGIPAVTLQKIFSGKTKNPRQAATNAIECVLLAPEEIYRGKSYAYSSSGKLPPEMVEEPPAPYGGSVVRVDSPVGSPPIEKDSKTIAMEVNQILSRKKQGEYTLEDYMALPDEVRYELIDGVLFEMNSPRTVHQDIASIIHMAFYEYIRKTKKPCKVFEAPVDVQLDCDNRTMLQPDVMVICQRDRIRGFGIYGAPDFVLEILSPSTRKKDMALKLQKYLNAGVREYWIIDPDRKVLITYDFSNEAFLPVIHTLEEKVPVAISGGQLVIDLEPVAQSILELGSLE